MGAAPRTSHGRRKEGVLRVGGRVVRIAGGKEGGREEGGDDRRTVLKGNGKTVVRNPKATAAAEEGTIDPTPCCFPRAPFNLTTLNATFSYACVTTRCTCTVFGGNASHVWLPGNFCSRSRALFSPKWRHPIPQVVACIAHIRSFFSRDTCNQSTFLTSSCLFSSAQPSTIHILGTAHRCGWLERERGREGERML